MARNSAENVPTHLDLFSSLESMQMYVRVYVLRSPHHRPSCTQNENWVNTLRWKICRYVFSAVIATFHAMPYHAMPSNSEPCLGIPIPHTPCPVSGWQAIEWIATKAEIKLLNEQRRKPFRCLTWPDSFAISLHPAGSVPVPLTFCLCHCGAYPFCF